MKRNAIVRIIIYSLIILVLLGLLLAGLGLGQFTFHIGSGDFTVGGGSFPAEDVRKLDIDWAAGSITIKTGDVDQISISETGSTDSSNAMGYKLKGNTLSISFSTGGIHIGFLSTPQKNLTVIVPEGWICDELDLDGAALDISIENIHIDELNIDGASNDLEFTGTLGSLDCDGASNKLNIICSNDPSEIALDGASITLNLTLPENCGYRVEIDGLSCNFRSDYHDEAHNTQHHYGNEKCSIIANGVSCTINIKKPQ